MNREQEEVLVGVMSISGEPIKEPIPTGEVAWPDVLNKPFEYVGNDLKVENGRLNVDKVDEVGDFTKPITARAVNTTVGNINALLELI